MKKIKHVMLLVSMLITSIIANAQWIQIGNSIRGEGFRINY